MPLRIQRQRVKGWRMPSNTVYVGRPSRWGNRFEVGKHAATREEAVEMFKEWLTTPEGQELAAAAKEELTCKDLACWCPQNQPCHADVLLEIAND